MTVLWVYVYACGYMCICVYVCICAYIYIYMCVFVCMRQIEIKVKDGLGDENMAGKESRNRKISVYGQNIWYTGNTLLLRQLNMVNIHQ